MAVKRSVLPHGFLQWLLVAFIVFVSVGALLPVFNTTCARGSQTRSLAQAKQIGLALKLFAGDNEGYFPKQGVPVENKEPPANANVAYAALFPTYTMSESIFGNRLSAYHTKTPDNVIDPSYTGKPVKTLEPGENVYGYVMGLKDDAGDVPLVVDGTDGSKHYNRMEKIRGGVWKGERAIVIRADNSGSLVLLAGPDHSRYLPRRDGHGKNLLDVSNLGKDVRYLDPAVAGP